MSDTTPEHENHKGTEPTDAESTLIEPMPGETVEIPEESLPAFFAAPAAPAEAAAESAPHPVTATVAEPTAPELVEPAPVMHEAAAPAVAPLAEPQPYYPDAPVAYEPPTPQTDYVPAATASATTAATTAHTAPYDANASAPVGQYAPGLQPIFVQAPTPPSPKGNRGAGILIGLVATVAFALLYAGSTFLISLSQNASLDTAGESFALFVAAPVFYVPVIFFFGAFALLVAIVNRGGWWAYVLGGFAVAVIVYFSFIGGSLLTVSAWTLTPSQAGQFIAGQWLNPVAIVAAIAAREVPIWFGAWIAARGRKVTARNLAVRQEYDRVLADGPTLTRP